MRHLFFFFGGIFGIFSNISLALDPSDEEKKFIDTITLCIKERLAGRLNFKGIEVKISVSPDVLGADIETKKLQELSGFVSDAAKSGDTDPSVCGVNIKINSPARTFSCRDSYEVWCEFLPGTNRFEEDRKEEQLLCDNTLKPEKKEKSLDDEREKEEIKER